MKYCNFKFESLIRQNGRRFYRQLFNSVKLVAFPPFSAGNSYVRGQTTTATVAKPFFYVCKYVSDPVWRKAVLDGFSLTFVVCTLPRTGIDAN